MLIVVAGDRPVPQGVDAVCVGVADVAAGGGHFGRAYRLEGDLAGLPQTLRVEPGSASAAYAWVRADRGGVPVARAAGGVDFGGDVTLALDRCQRGRDGMPQAVGAALGPASARLVTSRGAGGDLVVAIGAESAIIDAVDGEPTSLPAPAPPPGAVTALIAADLDGDCDDDVIVVTGGAAPAIWRRTGTELAAASELPSGTVTAIAAADVDRDGDIDLVTGAGGTLALWRNDGGGTFTHDPAALDAGGRAASIRALALGDLDGDGNPELVVGQAGQRLLAWLGDKGGTGSFLPSDGIVPPHDLDVARFEMVDADGDFDPDLAVAVVGGPLALYVARDGRLEDQSENRLPKPPLSGNAIAIAGWDAGCEPDAVIASDGGAPTLHGEPGGTLAGEAATAPAASDVVMADLDDDGVLDAVFATAEGVVWLAR